MHLLEGLLRHGRRRCARAEAIGEDVVPVHQHRRPGGDGEGDNQHRRQKSFPEKAPGTVDGGTGLGFGLRR